MHNDDYTDLIQELDQLRWRQIILAFAPAKKFNRKVNEST